MPQVTMDLLDAEKVVSRLIEHHIFIHCIPVNINGEYLYSVTVLENNRQLFKEICDDCISSNVDSASH